MVKKLVCGCLIGTMVGVMLPPAVARAEEIHRVAQNPAVLVEGSQGDAVRSLQRQLKALGFYRGAIDGRFEAGTKAAAIAFQRSRGLTPDGIVGARTLAAITAAVRATSQVAILSVGSRGTRVRSLQQRLRSLGYYRGEIDGIFSTATRNAVIGFQRDRGLGADGLVGEDTFAALGRAVAGRTSSPPVATASTSNGVKALQQRLQELGFYRGAIDGLWGPATQSALEKAQQFYGVSRSDLAGGR